MNETVGLAAHASHASRAKDRTAVALESETAQRMAEAATTFLAALAPDQRQQARLAVDDEERLNWHYIPKARRGLSFKEMDTSQAHLAHALISSGMSRRGYAKAATIMSLEKVLGQLEGAGSRLRRDSELYFVTVFGTPGDREPWGWRVEGHHVSLNFLVLDGQQIASTPNFLGANPARVPGGDLAGLRVLAAEEDLARHLLAALDEPRRRRVLFLPDAPADILTRAERHVHRDDPAGLPAAEMADEQRRRLQNLVNEYVSRMPADIADTRLNRIERDGPGAVHFAWAGTVEAGGPHYYRLQAPSFLVEYDNTQNNANHVHTVWRDFEGDWGGDLLARHYARSH